MEQIQEQDAIKTSSDECLQQDLKMENSVFREKIRKEKIPSFYWGPAHVLFNATLLMSSILFYAFKIKNPGWWELLPYIAVLIVGNLAVFLIHKYPLHGRYWWNSYAYGNHTKTHHVFFTQNNVTWKDKRDWYTMFFPPEIVLGFILAYHPFFYFILKPLIGANATYAYLLASSAYFILYEIVHYCSHLPSDHFMMKIGFLKSMRRHHQLHHDPKLMGKYNFCIVYPLFDILLGTYISDEKYMALTGSPLPESGDTDA